MAIECNGVVAQEDLVALSIQDGAAVQVQRVRHDCDAVGVCVAILHRVPEGQDLSW